MCESKPVILGPKNLNAGDEVKLPPGPWGAARNFLVLHAKGSEDAGTAPKETGFELHQILERSPDALLLQAPGEEIHIRPRSASPSSLDNSQGVSQELFYGGSGENAKSAPTHLLENGELDAVVALFTYHDFVKAGADREKLNRTVFERLKLGGIYVIAYHQAPTGSGLAAAGTLHRLEEPILRAEVEAAGFVLDGEGLFLRDPTDMLEGISYKQSFICDRYLLRFKKPAAQ
ncbi:MAG: hypothetical protein GY822_26190 [Deltaproteobacteria bacterium]|nr:hypothetical protein [Deltaproteobacteria bacterium]